MELYLNSAFKTAQWNPLRSLFGRPTPSAPVAPSVNRNVGGVVTPDANSADTYQLQGQPDVSGVQELAKDYQTLTNFINELTKTNNQYRNAFTPLFQLYQQVQPAWQAFRQNVNSNPQFLAQINQSNLSSASQTMKRVLSMIAQMIAEQKKDFVQAAQIIQNAQQVFQAIATLAGAPAPTAQPATQPTPAAAVPAPGVTPSKPAANRDPRGRFMGRSSPSATPTPVQAVAKTIKLFPKFSNPIQATKLRLVK